MQFTSEEPCSYKWKLHADCPEYAQARLSNGPIESLNRITKDIKRIGRGYRNFEYIRNRFLFATRKNATVLGKPRDLEDTYLKAYYPNISEDVYDEDLEDNWKSPDELQSTLKLGAYTLFD